MPNLVEVTYGRTEHGSADEFSSVGGQVENGFQWLEAQAGQSMNNGDEI